MILQDVITQEGSAEFDESLPFSINGISFGIEASATASILLQQPTNKSVRLVDNDAGTPPYLLLETHRGSTAELCRLKPFDPADPNGWPTAAEVALVHCAQVLDEADFDRLTAGEVGALLYDEGFPDDYVRIALSVRKATSGPNEIAEKYTTFLFREDFQGPNADKVIRSFSQSFDASPVKYRFVELYRVFETEYLRDAFRNFESKFFQDPESALNKLASTLKSERSQLYALAEPISEYFEAIFESYSLLKDGNNRLIWALHRSISRKYGNDFNPSWKAGASVVYALRCAIVHAGEKDVVFEAFADGEVALEKIIPLLELAALRMIGIELS